MASAGEENLPQENSGRRTRSGRKVSAPAPPITPPRSTRRSSKKQQQEQAIDHEVMEIVSEEPTNKPDIISEMLAEAAQGVITESETVVLIGSDDSNDDNIIEETELIEEDHSGAYEECVIYEEEHQHEPEQPLDDDVEMYNEIIEDHEPPHPEDDEVVPIVSSEAAGLDDKSSSFPFAAVGGQSETSDDGQNETGAGGDLNEAGAAESSLLASLAGDNANSLPSVGGADDVEQHNKKDDFEATKVTAQPPAATVDLLQSDDSLSDPAIAEDLDGVQADNSDATIVNTEMVSEDELPLPTKPEINDAEEVSDDELPAPQRAELPADAEVISEDELLPAAATGKKTSEDPEAENTASSSAISGVSCAEVSPNKSQQSQSNSYPAEGAGGTVGSARQKRKAEEDRELPQAGADKDNTVSDNKAAAVSVDEQYNPMSPTGESNEATPPTEKRPKIDDHSDHKDRKKDKEKERDGKDRERDRERERERDRDKDSKEKERKKLPDLEKYWRAVREDAADFTGWTYLLQYVDNESDAEAAREAYDEFLSHYPYCYGYWRKYADYEKRKGIKANCNAVFERGLEAIPLSVDLWIHYLAHVRATLPDNEAHIRGQFERAVSACGLEFRSDKLWDAYVRWETEGRRYQRVLQIYDRLLDIPTQGHSTHFDSFQDFISQHSLASLLSLDDMRRLRHDVRASSSTSRISSTSRSKPSRASSKETEKDSKERDSSGSKTPPLPPPPPPAEAESQDEQMTGSTTPPPSIPADDATTSEELLATLKDEEINALKDKLLSMRRKLHKSTVAAVTERWSFEEGIKRPYFHVKPLERCQLKNWKDYLDFEIAKGDRRRILVLFERCLIACALYDEFWLKMIRYLEAQLAQQADPALAALVSDVFRRACQIHHPDKPSMHLMWSAYEECQQNFDAAARILVDLERKCPHLLQVAYRRINVERRRGDLAKCRQLYEEYIKEAKNKTIAASLSIKYARFLNKICGDLDGGLRVLRQALERDAANTRVALQMIDIALQRAQVDEDEVVLIMDKFMAREGIDPEQKVLFAQRKVEFLEDFGGTAQGLQDAQRALHLALNKANEAKKKRESSPSRKSSGTSANKDANSMAAGNQSAYTNNGSAAAANAAYGYGTSSSAYYGAQSTGGGSYQQQQQQSYDNYYNHWQYGSNYSNYGQWSGYNNYY